MRTPIRIAELRRGEPAADSAERRLLHLKTAMPSHLAYGLVSAAFALNLPFGAWRARTAPLSRRWFLAVHLPIPVIFLLRISAGYSYGFIPWLFLGAIGGQYLGGKALQWCRAQRTEAASGRTPATPEADASRRRSASQGEAAPRPTVPAMPLTKPKLEAAEDHIGGGTELVSECERPLKNAAGGLTASGIAGVHATQLPSRLHDITHCDVEHHAGGRVD